MLETIPTNIYSEKWTRSHREAASILPLVFARYNEDADKCAPRCRPGSYNWTSLSDL